MESKIRIWQSYSCNNSSSFRLVARFADAKTAQDSEKELTSFFKTHAQDVDKAMEENNYEFDDKPSAASKALAVKYGFSWKSQLVWGDQALEGDEPTLASEGKVLAIYHTYCGGFDNDLPKYFVARGARVEPEDNRAPTVTVLFALPKDAKKAKAVTKTFRDIFGQAKDHGYVHDWKKHYPWIKKGHRGPGASDETALFVDGKHLGFYLPLDPRDLPSLRKYLVDNGISDATIRLCEYADNEKFKLISAYKCDACGQAPLEYIADDGDQEEEQLACGKCGGMYDLKVLLAAKQKADKKAAKLAEKARKEEYEAKLRLKMKNKRGKASNTSKKKKAKAKTKTKTKR